MNRSYRNIKWAERRSNTHERRTTGERSRHIGGLGCPLLAAGRRLPNDNHDEQYTTKGFDDHAKVYNDKGETLSAAPFTIGPMATKSVSLSDILSSRINEGNGYLELQFPGAPVDIAAQALIQKPSARCALESRLRAQETLSVLAL